MTQIVLYLVIFMLCLMVLGSSVSKLLKLNRNEAAIKNSVKEKRDILTGSGKVQEDFGEVFKTILERDEETGSIAKIHRILPTKQDLKDSTVPIVRGSLLGFFIGVLPGAGATLASFFSYTTEKKFSKKPETFGKGNIAGVAGPMVVSSNTIKA